MTMENRDAVKREIESIVGPDNASSDAPDLIPYLKDLKVRFGKTIDSIKATPPEDFAIGEGGAVNADEELPAQ